MDVQEAQDWLLMLVLATPFYCLKGLPIPLYRLFHFLVLPKDFILQAPVHEFVFKGTSIIVLQMLGRSLAVMCEFLLS